ncbi:dihydrolipoamide dehydrogenase [Rhodothalassium salexigens DSM 2132]|uniref:Dihydrolipoyl dehydrogenase n=1 Tax=Rhodothalassium salexigens DSM 2132 TaxID=1188247 RepID=A0A4R2PDW6_RHOSA|nr:dihydrolipoyl dehydrogenase [Rhodothalassium salexigens]MBB4211986.1 dihydrolipoamide dehydrogenase [Rhodothalassium salexigens DSM 2132]MBK1638648.1 dihydrolipoyl dehydrogenase [Rhodothalassium salexigens DSM 2132]TCP33430.1 dihydrolipoamide dehydrogenase [Rhodothalassium salexigens DSM 2132]
MADNYDVVVIGGGPGGYVAAIRAAQLGLKTACVEMRGALGGTCLNVGCIPSKALLHASHLYHEAKSGQLSDWGLAFKGLDLDLDAMMATKDKSVKELTDGVAFLLKKNKVEWIKGRASFQDKKTLSVALSDGGSRTIGFKNAVIATGSRVTPLKGVEPDGERVITSTEALSLTKVPKHLLVIGGGYIGLEMGSVWRRLGAEVTVVEYADRILPHMDQDLAKNFTRLLKKQGFTLKTKTKVTGVEVQKTQAKVTVEPAKGGTAEEIKADLVLLSIGRVPNTEGLALDKAGLATDERGRVPIDRDFATKVPGIWAIGDVVEGPMLAHKAEDEGMAVAETIAGLTGQVNHDLIPSVVYTHPEMASVGKTEEQLKAAGVDYRVGKFPFQANSRAKANRDTDGFVKILADKATDRVLGVHIMGSEAGTMIAEATMAMEFGASAEDIALTCHAHPTHSEAVKEAALAVHDRPIHI